MLDWVEVNSRAGGIRNSKVSPDVSERTVSRSIAAARRGRAMAYFSAEGRLIEANAGFLALYGYAMGDIKGAQHDLFVAPGSPASRRNAAMWRELSVGVPQLGEFERIDGEGQVFTVLERLETLKSAHTGETKGVLSTAWPNRLTLVARASANRTAFECEGAVGF